MGPLDIWVVEANPGQWQVQIGRNDPAPLELTNEDQAVTLARRLGGLWRTRVYIHRLSGVTEPVELEPLRE